MGGRGGSSATARVLSDGAQQGYWLEHRPGNPIAHPEYTTTIDNITGSGYFPDDYLSHPEYYFIMNAYGARETISTLRSIQGNPNAEVTIYRGGPSSDLNTGDWVSLSRTYASEYAETPGSKVTSYKVKANQLSFDGDDISEYGYWGAPIRKK